MEHFGCMDQNFHQTFELIFLILNKSIFLKILIKFILKIL